MRKTARNRVIPQMFDVRVVDRDGNLLVEKLSRMKRVVKIEKKFFGGTNAVVLSGKREPNLKKKQFVKKLTCSSGIINKNFYNGPAAKNKMLRVSRLLIKKNNLYSQKEQKEKHKARQVQLGVILKKDFISIHESRQNLTLSNKSENQVPENLLPTQLKKTSTASDFIGRGCLTPRWPVNFRESKIVPFYSKTKSEINDFSKLGQYILPAAIKVSSPVDKATRPAPKIKKSLKVSIGAAKETAALKTFESYEETKAFDGGLKQSLFKSHYLDNEKSGKETCGINNKISKKTKKFFLPSSNRWKKYREIRLENELALNLNQKKRFKKGGGFALGDLAALISKFQLSSGRSFIGVLLIFSLIVPGFSFINSLVSTKERIMAKSKEALADFANAKENLESVNFREAAESFSESYQKLSEVQQDLVVAGSRLSDILRFFPGVSKIASANYLIEAGKSVALAGEKMTKAGEPLLDLKNPLTMQSSESRLEDTSFSRAFLTLQEAIRDAQNELEKAENNLKKVNIDDLPEDMRAEFLSVKEKIPAINGTMKGYLADSEILMDVLGYNGPRKYLFLFQNNQEMRATGGFIGSYGVLDIFEGRIKKLFIDDIYDPDGQLAARVIPPSPIQKMSVNWSMHDANWFPNFPTSAEKVAWFYEKTGGPTVDGVIALTPTLIQNLLETTGPIEMEEYDTVVDKNNFIEKTQYEVEVDYDKKLNQPKKFIADLTPKVFDEVFNSKNPAGIAKVLMTLEKALKEKHLVIYSKNYKIQNLLSTQNWSGEIKNTRKDYLMVVNTNINGYKTDGVIDETIEHESEIQENGAVLDTVTVTRKHNGGKTDFEWWNKVNADYMRVYVPKGSKLLSAEGHTREYVTPPVDYHSLGFKKDPQVASEEENAVVDEKTGTRIYEENEKTVFANWVYVSPGETVQVKYTYLLPISLSFDPVHHPVDSFSVLYQKQPGSLGSKLVGSIKMPKNNQLVWRYPDNLKIDDSVVKFETILNTDKFIGLAVGK